MTFDATCDESLPMVKTRSSNNEIKEMRELLQGSGSVDGLEDLSWARAVVQGEQPPPPATFHPDLIAALIEELVARGNPEPLSWLATLSVKPLAKAARTGLHRMRSRKVDVAVPTGSDSPLRSVATGETSELPGLITAYDGRNQRMIWCTDEAPKGLMVWEARTSSKNGLIDFRPGKGSRKTYRQLMHEVKEKIEAVKVDASVARWLIHDAAKRCEKTKRGLPNQFLRASQEFGAAPKTDHPALSIAPKTDASSEELCTLYDLPVLRGWYPGREPLYQLVMKQQEILSSQVIVDDKQRDEQFASALDKCVEDYYDASRTLEARQIVLDTAHFLSASNDPENAALARQAVDLYDRSPAELAQHPFARKLIERALPPISALKQEAAAAQAAQAATNEDEGRIVTG